MSLKRENSSMFVGTTVALLVAGATVWWVHGGQQKRQTANDKVPHISSWIPHVGIAGEYFSSVLLFMRKYTRMYEGHPAFSATILGRTWYFLVHPADVRKVFRTPEKKLSLYRASLVLAAGLFPTEEVEGRHLSDSVKKTFRGPHMEGLASTPLFVHALKQLPTWLPLLQEAFQYNFQHNLQQDSGVQDLFDWSMDLISLATARVMLGGHIGMDVVNQWVQLVKECDLEKSLTGRGFVESNRPHLESKVYGERLIYRQTREFIYPYVDQEIEDFLAGKPSNGSVIAGLVAALYKMIKDDDPASILRQSKVRIANDLIFFTFAAITNSYGASSWALYHILHNTEGCGDQIRREIDASEDDDSLVDISPTLEYTILEITRLYAPGNTFRYTQVPFSLASDPDIIIPADSVIAFNSCLMARSEAAFVNPSMFNPARFDPSHKNYQGGVDTFYYGFGFGSHPCVGRKFAISEIAIFVAEALKTFDFELVSSKDHHLATIKPEAVELTRSMFSNVEDHPILDPGQLASIWRPVHPVYVKYQRKKA